jgi:hypothetical protein
MSYFDDASLVMIPSGYKTSKVYSVKPTDGSGDLTFTRSNDTATRVGPDGLIEKVRTNLILQSQAFNTTWATNASPTITANTTVAPDGTTTADTIASTGASSGAYQVPTVASGVEYSFSVYVKNITTATNIQIGCDLGPINGFVNFNAVTGAITSAAAGVTGSSVTDAGNGWYRVSGTYVSTGTTNTFIVFGQSGMTFAVWGAQLEAGVTTDYIATTSAAVSVGPVANVPRLDYLNSSCPRLLLEPQRTNILTFSEQLNNAAWGNAAAVTANSVVSPDGYTNGDTVTGILSQLVSYTSGTAYTFSVFAKKNTGSTLTLRADATAAQTCAFNLDTLVTSAGGTITNYGNGWYRCAFTFTATATATGVAYILPPTSVYLYGAQHEVGAYATSYIPTLGAAVTRGADGAGTSDVFGTTFTLDADFGLYWEGVMNGSNVYPVFYSGGNYAAGADFRSYYTYTGSVLQLFGVSETLTATRTIALTAGTYYKILVKRVGSTIKWYVNGTEYANESGFTTTTVKIRSLFGSTLGAPNHESVAQALIFQTTISDADAIALTA